MIEINNSFSSGRYSAKKEGFLTRLDIDTPNIKLKTVLTLHEYTDLLNTLKEVNEKSFLNEERDPYNDIFRETKLLSNSLISVRKLCFKKLEQISYSGNGDYNGEKYIAINNEKYIVDGVQIYAYCSGGMFLDKNYNIIGEHQVSTEMAVDILESLLNAA